MNGGTAKLNLQVGIELAAPLLLGLKEGCVVVGKGVVGCVVGCRRKEAGLGAKVGSFDDSNEGLLLAAVDGKDDSSKLASFEGVRVGTEEGARFGPAEGLVKSVTVGSDDGPLEGRPLGCDEGALDGEPERMVSE